MQEPVSASSIDVVARPAHGLAALAPQLAPDNARAVDALLAELRELGYVASTHGFAFGGRILRNVLAGLPGSGELGVDADLIVVG